MGYIAVIGAFAVVASTRLFKPVFLVAAAFMGLATVASLRLLEKSETDKTKRRFYFRK